MYSKNRVTKKQITVLTMIYVIVMLLSIILFDKVAGNEEGIYRMIYVVPIILVNMILPMALTEYIIVKKYSFHGNKDIAYFREIIPNISPAVICAIMDTDENIKNDYISTLLSLKLKGYIDIIDNSIIKNENGKVTLSKSEEYFFSKYKSISAKDGIITPEVKKWYDLIIEELNDNGLIKHTDKKENEYKLEKIKYERKAVIKPIGILGGFATFLCLIGMAISNSGVFGKYIFLLSLILYVLSGLTMSISNAKYIANMYLKRTNIYELTDKGKSLRGKLIGLKQYITDFSLLSERSQQEIVLWEDYMIYTIAFNIKGNLYKEIRELYDYLYENINF